MIRENVRKILSELPAGVSLVGAAKTRAPAEILEAVEGGLRIVGENYVQEAERALQAIGSRVKWHMIGHLQTNKARKAVTIFDMIETVDSLKLAREIDKACQGRGRDPMEVLIEINSAREAQKAGVMPEDAIRLIREMAQLPHIKVAGLMTMGPITANPEEVRPYYRRTKALFDEIRALGIPGADVVHLSMGMSDSYRVALEEGANMVRIGTAIFGARKGTS